MSTNTTSARTSWICRRIASVGLDGKPHVSKNIAAHLRALQPLLEDREPFFVFGKKGDRYAMHGWNLNYVPVRCMLRRDQKSAK